MTAEEVLKELEGLGDPKTKEMMIRNHGIREPYFGVKVGDMKPIQKRIKVDHELALELFGTGNHDAMYLAGLIADDGRMSRKELQAWVDGAYSGWLYGWIVPWVAAGGPHGWVMAMKWIKSSKPRVAAAGWATVSSMMAVKADEELDLKALKVLLGQVREGIHEQPDEVRHAMNAFVIALGSCVAPMTGEAIKAGDVIGQVSADLGNNSCKTPFAPDAIRKVEKRGAIGKKRKSLKC